MVTLLEAVGLLLFLMMVLYISMVRSSYIIIVSGMGDNMPILGAVVTLFDCNGVLLFFMMFLSMSTFRLSSITSFYLVWEMTCQFLGLW